MDIFLKVQLWFITSNASLDFILHWFLTMGPNQVSILALELNLLE